MKEDKGYRDFSGFPDHELEWAAVDSKDEKKWASARAELRQREREHQQRLADRVLWVAVFAAFASGCSALAAIINLSVQSLAR
jgi:hypothetical protein